MKKIRLYIGILIVTIFATGCSSPQSDKPYRPPEPEDGFPENIILFVGDGMGLAHVTAAETVNNGLNITSLNITGLMTTHAADRSVSESAASATAMATGVKTNYKMLGVNPDGEIQKNIFEHLQERGYATGIVTTSYLQDATPAAFYAHAESREMYDNIAMQMASAEVDVYIGGGSFWLNEREDELNLIDTMSSRGYAYYQNINDVPLDESGKLLVVQAQYRLPGIEEERGDFLQQALSRAISRLDRTGRPWFLVVENEHIDLKAHDNLQDEMLAEVADLDLAVGNALSFAAVNQKTLIVVTGDHETGGYSIVGGNVFEGTVSGDFQADNHTAVMVPVYAKGPGEMHFSGVYDNTDMFNKFTDLLKINAH